MPNIIVMTNDEKLFATFDLGCSAALIDKGFVLVTLDRTNLRKAQFIFRRTDDIDEMADEYWTGTLQVGARSFFDTLKMLKNRLYSE